jgi:hypothetical protein
MIVCSLPRCGATRFCLDHEKKTGLKFVGELHPIHIDSNRKAEVHETGFQINFSPSEFADLLHNNDDNIVLINQHPYLMVNQASFVILRKNMKDASLSLANFLLKMYPGMKTAAIIQQIKIMHNDHLGLMVYLNKYPRDIVWYEDYYNTQGTTTPLLDKHLGRDLIIKEIETYYGSFN